MVIVSSSTNDILILFPVYPDQRFPLLFYNDNFRDIGFGESFQQSSMKNLDKHISDGSGNIAILPDSSHFLDYSIPVK